MLDRKALAMGVLLAAGLLVMVFAGQVLRLVTRWVSWAALVLLVVAAGYVTYQLFAGWRAAGGESTAPTLEDDAGETDATGRTADATERTADAAGRTADATGRTADAAEPEAVLPNEALEAELEILRETADADAEPATDDRNHES